MCIPTEARMRLQVLSLRTDLGHLRKIQGNLVEQRDRAQQESDQRAQRTVNLTRALIESRATVADLKAELTKKVDVAKLQYNRDTKSLVQLQKDRNQQKAEIKELKTAILVLVSALCQRNAT